MVSQTLVMSASDPQARDAGGPDGTPPRHHPAPVTPRSVIRAVPVDGRGTDDEPDGEPVRSEPRDRTPGRADVGSRRPERGPSPAPLVPPLPQIRPVIRPQAFSEPELKTIERSDFMPAVDVPPLPKLVPRRKRSTLWSFLCNVTCGSASPGAAWLRIACR